MRCASHQALAVDANNVKALYRRAQAHRNRDDFDAATADISAAIKLAPTDRLLRAEVLAIQVCHFLCVGRFNKVTSHAVQ
jgi:cytochrome c-type biogenesis protein CcmH/NrfG